MKALPWILVVFLLVACATPRNSDRDTHIDYSDDFSRVQARMDSLMLNMQLVRKETSEKLSNLKIENKTVYLSPPDSVGKQYPTAISKTTANKEEKENKAIDTELNVTIRQLVEEVSELKQQLSAAVSEKEKVVEVSWWDLHKMDVYAGVFALILAVYFINKVRKK